MVLDVPELSRGGVARLRVRGAAPRIRVVVLASVRGPGVGPCADDGSSCASILEPTADASAVTDRAGSASVTLRLPAELSTGAVWLQARVHGATPDLTEVEHRLLLP